MGRVLKYPFYSYQDSLFTFHSDKAKFMECDPAHSFGGILGIVRSHGDCWFYSLQITVRSHLYVKL